MEEGKHILKFIIYLLLPIFPCVTAGMISGLMLCFVSIYHLFYSYKKIIVTIMREGENSEHLLRAWSFGPYNVIFFCAQFVINCFFLEYLAGMAVFITFYALSCKELLSFTWKIAKALPVSFWLGLVPVTIGYLIYRAIYFPFFTTHQSFIKNKSYFSFWDTWYFLVGNFGALLKAATRYFLGIGSILVLGYRVNITIMPVPFDKLDTLYCGFYASIATHCMNEGIIPTKIRE